MQFTEDAMPGPDDRIERRSAVSLDADERAAIQQRLDRMDRSGKTGPWTTIRCG